MHLVGFIIRNFALISTTTEFVHGIVNEWTDKHVAKGRQTGRTDVAVLKTF